MPDKKFIKIFFATDLHGSETCFRKFLGAANVYKADVLVLGGDITGKMIVPIVDLGNGIYRAEYLGKEMVAKTPEEMKGLEQLIADSGYYHYRCDRKEMDELKTSKDYVNKIFLKVMKERLVGWAEYAERGLKDMGVCCYLTGGNDDYQEVIDAVVDSEHVKNADNKVNQIDPKHEMLSLGWSNMTPWKLPRDRSEEELEEHIGKLVSKVTDMKNCIFNLHTPPIDCGLDTAPKLDETVYPPKPVFDKGQQVTIGAGSKAVRQAIEKHQPLIDLCGHIHESRGVCKIGKTLVVNPGSEYTEGILRGAMVNLADNKVVSWQLVAG